MMFYLASEILVLNGIGVHSYFIGNNSSVYKLSEASQESHHCHLSHILTSICCQKGLFSYIILCYCWFVQVTGFSVGGRIIDGNGMGVEGVKIIVDGHERSATDKEGYYKLDQV